MRTVRCREVHLGVMLLLQLRALQEAVDGDASSEAVIARHNAELLVSLI